MKSLYSVFVPFVAKFVQRNISQEDAYALQEAILNQDRAVTWVIYYCEREKEFEKVLS